ncbi:dGTP triphosphohydrolase [Enterococcus rivorum]|nr:dNTP triphosphohydrolase [Enterococcus rivorum]MBP2100075.1 dGTPase [Enterococcus rivorum]
MEWNQLVSNTRVPSFGTSKETLENVFSSDYRRVVKSDSFRRLQDKTQVFPLERNDFVRTRLTHSLEVAMHARDLLSAVIKGLGRKGIKISELDESFRLLETAALIHDIGNPPFGHFGEEAIRIWFIQNGSALPCWSVLTPQQQADFIHFEGNAQTIRLLTKIHDDNGASRHGMKLAASTMDAVIKYTANSIELDKTNLLTKKVGYFYSETKEYKLIKEATGSIGKRHPLVYILEAADDLAYTFSDIEDAYNYGFYSYNELVAFVKKTAEIDHLIKETETEAAEIQHFLREAQKKVYQSASAIFVENYAEIMQGNFDKELIIENCEEVKLFEALKAFAIDNIFSAKEILDQEVLGFNIMSRLLDELVPVVLKYEKEEMNQYEKRLFNNIPESAEKLFSKETRFCSEDKKDYYRLKMAVDFVCNMTDGYAKKLHDRLFS